MPNGEKKEEKKVEKKINQLAWIVVRLIKLWLDVRSYFFCSVRLFAFNFDKSSSIWEFVFFQRSSLIWSCSKHDGIIQIRMPTVWSVFNRTIVSKNRWNLTERIVDACFSFSRSVRPTTSEANRPNELERKRSIDRQSKLSRRTFPGASSSNSKNESNLRRNQFLQFIENLRPSLSILCEL